MEPLRGGKLVTNLPKEVYRTFDKAKTKRSPAEWALKWIWNQPEVTLVLSGMNSMEMLNENIKVASETEINAFTEDEKTMFAEVKETLQVKIKVPCTACNYCMPCPAGVDIPTCLSCYNDIEIEGRIGASVKYLMQTSLKSKPTNASLCVMCGKCEEHCPQGIEVMKELKNVTKKLEGIHYKPVRAIAKRFMKL
jgi:predicted aldo/keto reductase-like oxidoreductase